jgi:TRAP-type C4-dicarboxylate transport system substrate-binding protein
MKAAMGKRVFGVMLAMFFGLVLVGSTIAQAQGPAKAIPTDIPEMKLKYATFIAPAGTQAEMIKWMLQEITRRSGGKVKIEEYWQEALLKDADLTAGCGAGTADMVGVRSTITVDKNPCWTTLDLPGQPENLWAAIWAVYDMTHNDPDIKAEFDKMNVVPTYAHNSNHQFLQTKKPVRTLKDAKGMRVRTYGGAQGTVLKHAGMVPVFVSLAEIYEGLSKGVIDGATSVYQFTWSFKYYEVAPYITNIKRLGGSLAATMFINKDRWNKFPPSLQKIIEDVSEEYNNLYIKKLMDQDAEVQKKITTQHNVKIFDLDAASQAVFDEGIKKAREEWFAKYDARGVNTRQVYARFQATVKKYEQEYASKGYPWNRK